MQNLHNIGWIHSFSLSFLHPQTINLLIEQSGIEFPSSSLLSQLRLYIHLGAGQGICVYVSARVYAGQGPLTPILSGSYLPLLIITMSPHINLTECFNFYIFATWFFS